MRKVVLLLLITITYYAAAEDSAVSLRGRITDNRTGEAIAGAAVYIPDLKRGTLTDSSGFFVLENLPKSKILVEVIFLGYRTIIENVDLNITTTKDFSLEPVAAEMNVVVVTGTSEASEIKRNPIPINTIGSEEMVKNLNTNAVDAIANIPGVDEVTTGPNISKPFIRGMGFNRILTLYDGVRQEGQQWGDEHGVEIDEYAISKVEVVKGPASLIYGSDALAGVVNFIPHQPVPEGTVKGNVTTDYQSNNRLIGTSGFLSGNKNGLVWHGQISHKQATNYRNKFDGRVYGTAFNETDANGFIGLDRHWGYSHLNFSVYNDLQEIPSGSRDSATRQFTKQITEADTIRTIVSDAELNSYKISPLHQHIQHYRIHSSSNFFIGNGKLALNFGYQQNIRQEYSHPEAIDIPGLYLRLHTLTYDIKYYLPEWKGWETTIGINGMQQNNFNHGTEFIIPDYNLLDAGLFMLIKKTYNKLDVLAGIRYDGRRFHGHPMYVAPNSASGFQEIATANTGTLIRFSDERKAFMGLSGSLGVTFNLSDHFFMKANIARGYRAPNVFELSATGVHPGTNIYQIGNVDFKPEFSLQEDAGFFFTSKYVAASVEIFNNDIYNYIFNQKVLNHAGQDSIIVKGNQTFKFQQTHAQIYGTEVSLDIHPHPLDWLHFENTVSVINSVNKGSSYVRINDSSRYLPFIPPIHTHSELRADVKRKFKHFSSVYFKIEMEHFAKQEKAYLENNTESSTASYTLLNAGFGADVINKTGKILFSLHIAANNIADVAYQSHLSRLKYFEPYPGNSTGRNGIYNMGRNIGIKIIIPIQTR